MMSTRNRLISGLTLAIFGILLLFSILLISHFAQAIEPADGGTDGNITALGEQGAGKEEWNILHHFVILESGAKMDDAFNVTVCENISYDEINETFHSEGHIFGKLTDIRWDDEPLPEIEISDQDFDLYKDDWLTLTVYVLEEYYRTTTNESEEEGEQDLRQAYKEIIVYRWNEPPVAVAMVTDTDTDGNGKWNNWTTVDSNEYDEIVYYLNEGQDHRILFLNASGSTDPNGDIIKEVRWDVEFGEVGCIQHQSTMNTTVNLSEGDHVITLVVGDGDMISEPLEIRIIVRQKIRLPDLMVQDLQVINKNGMDNIIRGDRAAVMAQVKNIGDNYSSEEFDVYFEYWYKDDSPSYPVWNELGIIKVSERIDVNGFKLVEAAWETGGDEFRPGEYSFRAIADWNEEINELREINNVYPSDLDENSAEVILLEEGCACGDPELIIEGMSETLTFPFSGDSNGIFSLKFEVRDDGIVVSTSDPIKILIDHYHPPDPQKIPKIVIHGTTPSRRGDGWIAISGTASDDIDVERVEYKRMGTYEWIPAEGTKYWLANINTNDLPDGDHTYLFRAYDGEYYSSTERITVQAGGEDSFIPGYELMFTLLAMVCAFGGRRRKMHS